MKFFKETRICLDQIWKYPHSKTTILNTSLNFLQIKDKPSIFVIYVFLSRTLRKFVSIYMYMYYIWLESIFVLSWSIEAIRALKFDDILKWRCEKNMLWFSCFWAACVSYYKYFTRLFCSSSSPRTENI